MPSRLTKGGPLNLQYMYGQADKIDIREGLLAYQRYHQVMRTIADRYKVPIERVIAGFVTLSPNNDYIGTLRSLVSMLNGIEKGIDVNDIVTSAYGHAKLRAYYYLTEPSFNFLQRTRGPKVLNFYRNILDPSDNRWVTIDGHIVAAWFCDPAMTMRGALLLLSEYRMIADAVKRLAFSEFMLPNQFQAIVWFARKRVCNARYSPHMNLFAWAENDIWQTYQSIENIKPFGARDACKKTRALRGRPGSAVQSDIPTTPCFEW